jgi:hypothetical protein
MNIFSTLLGRFPEPANRYPQASNKSVHSKIEIVDLMITKNAIRYLQLEIFSPGARLCCQMSRLRCRRPS